MKLRAEIMIRTAQCLKDRGWTQAEAARHLGEWDHAIRQACVR